MSIHPTSGLRALTTLCLAVAAACGGGSSEPSAPPPPPTVVSVELAPATVALVGVGATAQLTATVTTTAGVSTNPTVGWTSSSPSVATVSSTGSSATVTAVAVGTTTITAASDNKSATATVTVTPGPQVLTVAVSGAGAGTVTSTPAGINCPTTCSAPFPFEANVTLTAAAAANSRFGGWVGNCTGTTGCTVTMVAARTITATFEALPAPVASVSVTPGVTQLDEGASVQLVATLRDAAGNVLTGRSITWSSADTASAIVSGTGLVTGKVEGDTVLVSATSEGIIGRARVVVRSLYFIASQFSVGSRHVCAVRKIGGAYCWGRNAHGQLGNSGNPAGGPVARVQGQVDMIRVAAGEEHSCGFERGGTLWCWGQNFRGQLGNGGTTDSPVPTKVSGSLVLLNATAGPYSTCGYTPGLVLYCWGDNTNGYLGVQGPSGFLTTPTLVAGGLPLGSFATGTSHQCGVHPTTFALYCWGLGSSGQLGMGDFGSRTAVALVPGGTTWVAVAAGGVHTCATTFPTAQVWCFGLNNFGQLGTGTTVSTSTPVRAATTLGFTKIAAGAAHTCAIAAVGGNVWCWGLGDHGQLGTGVLDQNLVERQPVRVQSNEVFVEIDAADRTTCALTQSGRLYCWGDNQAGQLGAAPTWGSAVPVPIMRPSTP